jgi:hypothetical protein
MNTKNIYSRLSATVGKRLYRFFILQLFITLVSWPILIAWGLPLSLLSPLGNLLFSPFLTLSLFLSSLLFFTELLLIPNTWIAYLFEWSTQWWFTLLSWHEKRAIIACAQPYWWLLAGIACITVMVTCLRYFKKTYRSFVAFSLLCICVFGVTKLFPVYKHPIDSIACKKGSITIVHDTDTTIVIDQGYLASMSSAESWITFTLIPEVVKRTGHMHIDHFITLQPSSRIWTALNQLLEKITVDHLYIPLWEGDIPSTYIRTFCRLKYHCLETNTTLHRMGKYPTAIPMNNNNHCTVVPLDHVLKYGEGKYQSLGVTGSIDSHRFTLYAAQEKNKAVKGVIT